MLAGVLIHVEQQIGQSPDQVVAAQGATVDVLSNAELLDKQQVLPEHSDLPLFAARHSANRFTAPTHLSLFHTKTAISDGQQSALASPASSQQGDSLSLENRKRDRTQSISSWATQADVHQLKERGQRTLPS
jgi:hypothetical protein